MLNEELNLDSNVFFALGVLLGLIYTLTISVIIILFSRHNKPVPTNLGDLRHSIGNIQQELQKTEKQIWDYGVNEEERTKRWRINCTAMAAKAAGVLQSCWQGQGQDATARAIYHELLTSLGTVGIEEINPNKGDIIEENDQRYRINKKDGLPPYRITTVLYPGYYYRSPLEKSSSNEGKILLEPAVVEVENTGINSKENPTKTSVS